LEEDREIIFMKMEIIIKNDNISLFLRKGDLLIAKSGWKEQRDLSNRLLVEIDNLLGKKGLKPGDIESAKVLSDISDNFTTIRIAKTVAEAFNFKEC
jgi:hypothetical protein